MSSEPRLNSFVSRCVHRFPLHKASYESLVTNKTVPVHRFGWAYYLGGLALFFLGVQLITGLLLLVYYEPTVTDAHASVDYITQHVRGGAMVRNIHAWSSSLMIIAVLVHLLTTFAMKAFEKPREMVWVSGVVLLLITFGFGFTGYLLPWHQVAVNATKVGLQSIDEFARYLPVSLRELPIRVRELIQGGPSIGQSTLSRFYAIHVVVLPLLTLGVVGFHLLGIQLHGMSQGVDNPTGKTEKFIPFYILRDLSVWTVAVVVLLVIGICLPFESFSSYPLFAAYNPLGATPEGIKPEWYFYFIFYPLELLPFWLVAVLVSALVLVLFFAPVIFRRASRRTLTVLACAGAVYLVIMTVFGQQIYDFLKGQQ
ncbi:MAG: cytochrome b [Candidatus Sumerlaeaceae bacterium]